MIEQGPPEHDDESEISEDYLDPLNPEGLEEADRMSKEYLDHMRQRPSSYPNVDREPERPLHEIMSDLQELFSWLKIEDPEYVTEQSARQLKEFYSVYEIEDLYFIVYDELKGRRQPRFEDIIHEPTETDLLRWRQRETKRAADFLVIHGVNENEIHRWKGEEGSGRQQRAMRRMFWLLNQPEMAQFTDYLSQRATSEQPYDFKEMSDVIYGIIIEQARTHQKSSNERSKWVPRKQEDYRRRSLWLKLAYNLCVNVFVKDARDGVYE